ncbi:MAG: hypothetical protein ACYC9S_05450 [Leptospirales bacterium]
MDVLSIQAEIVTPLSTSNPALRDPGKEPDLDTLIEALKISGADYLMDRRQRFACTGRSLPCRDPEDFWAAHGGI